MLSLSTDSRAELMISGMILN